MATIIGLIGFILSLKVKTYENKQELKVHLTLNSIMKKDVFTVKDTDNLLTVLKTITNHKISGAPVVDKDNNLVGFISDGDIMRFLAKAHPLFTNAYSFVAINNTNFNDKLNDLMKHKAKDICKKKVTTTNINTSIEDVCNILNEKHLKKIPVMKNGKMVGIINRSNITKYAIETYLKA